jgi:hypothetical protein
MADDETAALVPIDAMPDGILLSEWAAENSVGRTASFAFVRILKARGLEPERVRQAGVSKPSPFLSGRVLEAINLLLREFKAGRSIASLEAEHGIQEGLLRRESEAQRSIASLKAEHGITDDQSSLSPSSKILPPVEAELHDEHVDVDRLFQRLKAAELAIATGLPLSKAEIGWILGASPTTEYATTAPVRVEKRSARGWALLPPA